MEPRQQGLQEGGERAPVSTGGYEGVRMPESSPSLSPERSSERMPELGAVRAEAAQVAMPALPTPVVAAPAGVATSSDDDLPDVASDDDLIEKEWVDKAKKIIADTRDDPYRREQEISKLQVEYIRRRYGRQIGEVGE